MKYNTIKNIILASLSTIIFYMTLVEKISTELEICGLIIVFAAILSLVDNVDQEVMRKEPRMLTEEQFARYKEKVTEKVETRRAQGKDEAWIKNFIANYIAHEPRKIFSGPQINELLSLAKKNEESASVGKPNALG